MSVKQLILNLQDGAFHIDPECRSAGTTQSELTTFDTCAEKWYLRYGNLLEAKGAFSWALHFGSAFHASMEEFYLSGGKRQSWVLPPLTSEQNLLRGNDDKGYEYWNHVGAAMTRAYFQRYKDDFKVYDFGGRIEIEPKVEFEGVLLTGKIDALPLHKGKKVFAVMDHKTTSRLDSNITAGWGFRFQFLFYCWLATKHPAFAKTIPKAILINAMKKPELRLKVGESFAAFGQRVLDDIRSAEEGKYFHRELMILSKGQMERFEKSMLRPKVQRIKFMDDQLRKGDTELAAAFMRDKNTDACFAHHSRCEFFNICANGPELEAAGFRRREHKHNELATVAI